jgi:hypothetical protein
MERRRREAIGPGAPSVEAAAAGVDRRPRSRRRCGPARGRPRLLAPGIPHKTYIRSFTPPIQGTTDQRHAPFHPDSRPQTAPKPRVHNEITRWAETMAEPQEVALSEGSGAEPAPSSQHEEGEDGHDSHSFGGQVSPVSRDCRWGPSPTGLGGLCTAAPPGRERDPAVAQPCRLLRSLRNTQRARSQVSTAVSFEGARPAGSAALPSRSVDEESALSAAEADGAAGAQGGGC